MPVRASVARPRVLALVGATATGKTAVAELVAARLQGEIVCADSRQLFRELDLGTGKPTAAERAKLPHHLFDALELGERATAGGYAAAAAAVCGEILARARLPVIVGGSGLYLRALREGLSAEPPHDAALRDSLDADATRLGVPALHERLRHVDPLTAARLHPGDRQRVTRALEVYEASGRPLSWWHRVPRAPAFDAAWTIVELRLPAEALDARIAARTRAMFGAGLVEEVQALVRAGREAALRSLRAVGYDEALELIRGGIDRAEAERRTDLRTRQLAKRQRTWFRHQVEAERLEAAETPAIALADTVCAMHAGSAASG